MDGRGWPWKRKSSDKATTEKPVLGNELTNVSSLSYLASLENQDKCKNSNYVQITMDSYTHLSRMEDQVKLFENEVKDLKEKLTTAQSEIMTKESLIRQHAKVAEEAVSGWEKADAETLILKHQLESVTLVKLTAEDRASHLDDALKECTRQIRIVKDESDQKLQDVILAKTIHWEKTKADLEGKIDELSQGLHRAASDNAALTRSLQDRSEMIVRISEERSKAEANVEELKTNIQLAEKEISSLKYDVHVASKEVEIRNEEKNMSLKSAEIANRQHLEGVKKIAKLEAECQRLRGLLRKKLPGPAAMAQMKLEVESLGHEFTDPRAERSIVQSTNQVTKPEISAEHKWEECKKENAYLTRRTLEMEEEIQTLKKHLTARNSELQVSRNVCAKTLGKLKILEGQMHMFNNEKSAPKSNGRNLSDNPSRGHDYNYSPSATSVSEDGFDEEGSSSECGPAISTDSHKVKKESVDGSSKHRIYNRLELMDDFLEIEKLAANGTDGANSAAKSCNSACSSKSADKQSASKSNEQDDSTTLDQLLTVLRSRISRVFESQEGISIEKIVEATGLSIQEMQGSSPKQFSSLMFEVADETLEKHVLSSQDNENCNVQKNTTEKDLETAVSNIHHFIRSTTKEATQPQEMHGNGLSEILEGFYSLVGKYSTGESSLSDRVLELSRISVLASNLNNGAFGLKHHSQETTVAESNNKVTLLEKEVGDSDSDLGDTLAKTEDHRVDNLINGHEMDDSSCKSLLKELEQLKLEKENIALELSRCLQNLESTKAGLEEKLRLISELKSQLTSSRDLKSLAETQLKCVTESYKTLELRCKDLEAKVKSLEEETARLEMAFSTEKRGHEETLAKCKDLQEKMQRNESCRQCSASKIQPNQEKDIASATKKLAACQETIHLLSQQLKSLQPQSNHVPTSQSPEKKLRQRKTLEATPNSAQDDLPHDHIIQPSHSFRHSVNPTVHAIIKSSSVSSSSKEDNEKHARGLGRFFSSKPKSNGR